MTTTTTDATMTPDENREGATVMPVCDHEHTVRAVTCPRCAGLTPLPEGQVIFTPADFDAGRTRRRSAPVVASRDGLEVLADGTIYDGERQVGHVWSGIDAPGVGIAEDDRGPMTSYFRGVVDPGR